MNNAVISVGGYAIGLAGVALAIVAWRWPRTPVRQLSWMSISRVVLASERIRTVPGLRVSFLGQDLERATLLSGKLWSSGAQPVLRGETRALKLTVPDAQILAAWVTSRTQDGNEVTLSTATDKSHIDIDLDYLNPGDGIEFSIIHDGSRSADVTLDGALVGGSTCRVDARLPGSRDLAVINRAHFNMLAMVTLPPAIILCGAWLARPDTPQALGVSAHAVRNVLIGWGAFVSLIGLIWVSLAAPLLKARLTGGSEPIGSALHPVVDDVPKP